MAKDDFPNALPRILVYEGGKVDNPKDPGGRTNEGVTQTTYNSYRRAEGKGTQDVYLITADEVSDIYKTRFWDAVRGDDLPAGLDLCVFDGGVNSGPSRSGMWLQQALGSSYTGAIDGQIGDKTLQAIQDFGNIDELIASYCSHRLGTLKRLSDWKEFGAGWSARIANCQKTAQAWAAGTTTVPHPVDVTALGGHRKAAVNDNTLKKPIISQVTAHTVTVSGTVGTIATSAVQQLTPVADTFGWLKYVIGALTVCGAGAGIVSMIATNANKAASAGSAKATVDLDADSAGTPVPVNSNTPAPTTKAA